jgi:hypothetical protein
LSSSQAVIGGETRRPLLGARHLEANAEHWQQPLQNCRKTNESHEDFEQIFEPCVANKPIDQVKANCADNDDDQYVY